METTKTAVAELVGTFALVFIGATATVTSGFGLDPTGVALASGFVYGAMVAVTLPLGGGMLNPAVAIGLWVVGRRTAATTVIVIVAQLVGAVAAGILLRLMVPGPAFDAASGGAPAVVAGIGEGQAIAFEAMGAFLLVFAVFATAIDDRGQAGTAGLVCGLVLAADVLAFGPLTGAAVNPARWLGPALASGTWDAWYVWMVGPTAGGVLAAVLYSTVFMRDRRTVP